ncbi:MAG: hypothetical protein M1158_04050 [Candidatus Marsarchaeota archaeon]|nr:hypothetical protein [Candidatus Marsarchaeota archaeon]
MRSNKILKNYYKLIFCIVILLLLIVFVIVGMEFSALASKSLWEDIPFAITIITMLIIIYNYFSKKQRIITANLLIYLFSSSFTLVYISAILGLLNISALSPSLIAATGILATISPLIGLEILKEGSNFKSTAILFMLTSIFSILSLFSEVLLLITALDKLLQLALLTIIFTLLLFSIITFIIGLLNVSYFKGLLNRKILSK